MSCNGCRILRKGCSETCALRPCLQWIEGAEAQGHATVFVAKFFGRAGLMSFISAVPESQRPALFQSLLYEACGRTINPVSGAVGLLWSGNWHLCQAAVETVLRGGSPRPLPDLDVGDTSGAGSSAEAGDLFARPKAGFSGYSPAKRRKPTFFHPEEKTSPPPPCDLDLCLLPRPPGDGVRRPGTPSMNSEESVTTSAESGVDRTTAGVHPSLLNLFH